MIDPLIKALLWDSEQIEVGECFTEIEDCPGYFVNQFDKTEKSFRQTSSASV